MAPKNNKGGNGEGMQQIVKHQKSAVRYLHKVDAHGRISRMRRTFSGLFTDHCLRLKKVFEFLKLPAEIRNMIYWIVLVKSHSISRFRVRFRQPALTLVNKQIRSESLPVLYSNGRFKVYFGWQHGSFKRLQKLCAVSSAMPNLARITKLDIRFTFSPREHSSEEHLHLYIRMRKSKSGCSTLQNKKLVYGPGFEEKDQARIEAVYQSLRVNLLQDPYFLTFEGFMLAKCGMKVAVRALLYFAEKCPAAAEWVWMALMIRSHNA